ncbi:DUF6541 family protein [Microbacterium sp.]|uniref:DUF6541 family protein n=1 Tax=Microbacterium sp. TaxID=51671 RepID=UPI00356614B3
MILDWFAVVPAFLVGVAVVFLPGLLALYGVGIRGLALVAYAPLFSIASTASIALVFGQLGVAWTPITWAIASVALIGVSWLCGRYIRMPEAAETFTGRRILLVGLGIGVVFSAWRLVAYMGDPSAISQTNDAVFHMNALRHILETGDASSLHVNSVIGGRTFYPAAWHGIASMIALSAGVDIPVAANVLTVVIGALIWPLGIAWLTRTAFGSNVVAAYAAILAGSLQAFPLLMFQWGVLFPNALSTSIVPAGIAAMITVARHFRVSRTMRDGVLLALITAVTAGAILLSQPAAFLLWASISIVWLTFFLVSREQAVRRGWAIGISAALWLGLGVVWWFLARGTSGSHWPPFRGKFEVLLDVLLNGQVRMPYAFVISALAIVGLIAAARMRATRWFAVAWGGVSFMYILVAAIGNEFVRESILGAWYADPYRIAAAAPLVVIPLAALGLDILLRFAARRSGRTADAPIIATVGVVFASVVMVLIILLRSVAMPAFLEGTYDRDSRYAAADDSYLNPDERALLEELPDLVDADARVLGNPSTGAGFGYFLSGIDVFPRTWSPPRNEVWEVIAERLHDAATDDAVCDALEVYGDPEYVLDFGQSEGGSGKFPAPGMTDFAGQAGFELVTREGDVSLWRITACDR